MTLKKPTVQSGVCTSRSLCEKSEAHTIPFLFTSLSSLSLNSLCSQRSGFPDWRSQRKNNPGFGRSAGLMLQLLLTSTEAPWPKSTLSHCSLVWKAGTQKTRSTEGYFLGGASVTLGSLYAPETQICQLEARNGPCLGIETMFCGQSLE